MNRLGHYLKPGVRASAPGVLFSVVVTPNVHSLGGDERHQWREWGGCNVYVARKRDNRWTHFRSARCETPEQLTDFMHAHADRNRRNYVILPDGQEGFAQALRWDHLDNGNVHYKPGDAPKAPQTEAKYGPHATLVRRVTVSPRTFILDYSRDRFRWIWLSARQYFDAPEDALAQCIGFTYPDTGEASETPGVAIRTANDRAALWLKLFMDLSDWWLKHAKAPFGLTGSALSMGVLRTHVRKRYLCSHTDPDVLPLERAACFGGRAQTWYYGDVGDPRAGDSDDNPAPPRSEYGSVSGPMFQLDVKSMYPWLLREQQFPIKLREYRENALPSECMALAKCAGVIARVTVETDRAEYPERVGDRIYYRTGRFTTQLTGPELIALRGHGRVIKCHALAVYDLGRPYREAAGALIAMREDRKGDRNPALELFAKLLANGLGGKLAQRKGEWVPKPQMSAPVRFGEFYDRTGRKGKAGRFRAIAGMCWEYSPDPSGSGPFTASFAYLAAYGRLHMRGIRDVIGPGCVLSMDTDGIWVLPDGLFRAGGIKGFGGATAGSLVVKSQYDYGRFLGPRHYFTPDGWVLSGFTAHRVSRDGFTVRDSQRFTPLCGPCGKPGRGTAVRERSSKLVLDAHGLRIGWDGWAKAKSTF